MIVDEKQLVVLGKIGCPKGLEGWVWLRCGTEWAGDLSPSLWVRQPMHQVESGWVLKPSPEFKRHGNRVAIRFSDCRNRDTALLFNGSLVATTREALAPLAVGEYYWCDLQGLQVFNREKKYLGVLENLLPTGVHDVLVLNQGGKEILVPFVSHVIVSVNLDQKCVIVDWEADW